MSKIQEFDYSVDVLRVLIWQTDNATNLKSLVQNKQNWLNENHTQFWEDWQRDVFNLDSAKEFGLSVWALILGLPLFITIPFDVDKPIWGFDSDAYKNFDNGVFEEENVLSLAIEEKRIILKLRYFQLANRGAVPEINYFLNYVFKDKVIYALDGLDMTMTYVIRFPMSQSLFKALQQYDLFPRPEAVGLKFFDSTIPTFGFDNDAYKNFDNGVFIFGS